MKVEVVHPSEPEGKKEEVLKVWLRHSPFESNAVVLRACLNDGKPVTLITISGSLDVLYVHKPRIADVSLKVETLL